MQHPTKRRPLKWALYTPIVAEKTKCTVPLKHGVLPSISFLWWVHPFRLWKLNILYIFFGLRYWQKNWFGPPREIPDEIHHMRPTKQTIQLPCSHPPLHSISPLPNAGHLKMWTSALEWMQNNQKKSSWTCRLNWFEPWTTICWHIGEGGVFFDIRPVSSTLLNNLQSKPSLFSVLRGVARQLLCRTTHHEVDDEAGEAEAPAHLLQWQPCVGTSFSGSAHT